MQTQSAGSGGVLSEIKGRIRTVDLLRGVAVIWMILVHASDVVLDAAVKEGEFWPTLQTSFALVGPLFLFLSGWTTSLSAERREHSGQSLLPTVKRALYLLLIAYWLQLPALNLSRFLHLSRTDQLQLIDVNILHVIGVGIIGIILVRSISKRRNVRLAIEMVAIGCLLLASSLQIFQDSLLSRLFADTATFPLTPYLAYFIAGTLYAESGLARTKSKGPGRQSGTMAAWISPILAAGILLVTALAQLSIWENLFLEFILFVTIILTISSWSNLGFQRFATESLSSKNRSPVEQIGKHSLVIYILHLILIYGSPISMGMQHWWNDRLRGSMNLLETLLLVVAIVLLTAGVAIMWQRFRKQRARVATHAIWLFFILFLLQFLLF